MLLQTDRKLTEAMSLFESCVIQSISQNQVMKLSDICPTERAFKTEINKTKAGLLKLNKDG